MKKVIKYADEEINTGDLRIEKGKSPQFCSITEVLEVIYDPEHKIERSFNNYVKSDYMIKYKFLTDEEYGDLVLDKYWFCRAYKSITSDDLKRVENEYERLSEQISKLKKQKEILILQNLW
jgi:hypothetical protein